MTVVSASKEARATASAAGIVERADTQQRVIPESRRADGSTRKERKVRPGFTPVEDVVRYRPARAREAEEARKRGIPGSAESATALSSSSSSSWAPASSTRTPVSEKPDSDRATLQSNATRSPAASDGKNIGQQARGNFAPLEPPKQPRGERPPATTTTSPGTSERPSAGTKAWQNSRLRKLQSSKLSPDPAQAVTEAWDPEQAEQTGYSDRKAHAHNAPPAREKASTAADDLASKLDGLRIDSSMRSKDAEP